MFTNCNIQSIVIIILFLVSFPHRYALVVFHWNLSDSKSIQISETFLSILADLINFVVPIDLILPLISNSTHLFSKSLTSIPSAPTNIGTTITRSFFSFLARSKYLSIFLLSFIFILCYAIIIVIFIIVIIYNYQFTGTLPPPPPPPPPLQLQLLVLLLL